MIARSGIVTSFLGGSLYARMINLTGGFGGSRYSVPDLYREFATKLLDERPNYVEWNEQFTTGVRLIGALYVLLAVRACNKRHTED